MTLNEVIARLYSAEVDCGVESYRGAGVTAWVVNQRNHRIEQRFGIDELDEAAQWLCAEALRQEEGGHGGSRTRALLEELVGSRRKDPKRVTHAQRTERQSEFNRSDGTNS